MFKHIFWGLVVVILAVIAGFVALTITGHPEAASDLGGAVALAVVVAIFIWQGSRWF